MAGEALSQKLSEVEAVRQARLEAQQWRFQLERARNELAHKNAELQGLRVQLEGAVEQQRAAAAASGAAGQVDALEAARHEAEGYKRKLGATELELARQLDALRELQWRLDFVVAQLGPSQQQQQQQPAGAWPVAVDADLLLGKIGEVAAAQQTAESLRQQLAGAHAEAERLRAQCAVLQGQLSSAAAAHYHTQQQGEGQAVAGWAPGGPLTYTFEGVRHVRQGSAGGGGGPVEGAARASPRQAAQQPAPAPVSSTGQQLIGALLQENEELRGRLACAEERGQQLERDLDAELLIKAERRTQLLGQPQPAKAALGDPLSSHKLSAAEPSLRRPDHVGSGTRGGRDGSPARVRRAGVSESMELLAQRRLEFRLEEKEQQMGKLRGVIKELEAKLVEAYKRQADLVMKESSWREQESLDRRLAEADGEKAALAARLTAAQAEAEAARREAAVQRRLARRLQQQRPAEEESEANKQMAAMLQKRVKILEAQNIKLRLARGVSLDGSSGEISASGSGGSRRASGTGQPIRSESGEGDLGTEGSSGAGAGENRPPNSSASQGGGDEAGAAAGGAAAAAAGRGRSMLEGNPVLEKWEADKQLQKKVEALQGKLKEKAHQLAVSHTARERLAQQVAQLQGELAQTQAASVKQPARAGGECQVPVAPPAIQEQLARLDDVQQRHDVLERRLAALEQQRALRLHSSASEDGSVSLEGPPRTEAADPSGAGAAPPAAGARGSRPYRASDYGGPAAAQERLEAQLLEKDVKLFDLTLERDQAVAQAARLQQRLDALFVQLSEAGSGTTAASGAPAAGAAAAGRGSKGGRGKQPTAREQELLDTVALLKSALERTKKGLESGVSNSKYMQAVDKVKQLKLQVASLETQLAGAEKTKEELSRLQQQLGQLHAVNSALKGQLKAARQKGEDAASAREEVMNAQVAQLERALQERDVQLAQVKGSMADFDEEIRVLLEEGLHPAALVQELLTLRPRLRELEEQNTGLRQELASFDAQFFQELQQLRAEHELLRAQCEEYEGHIRRAYARLGEPLPPGLLARDEV